MIKELEYEGIWWLPESPQKTLHGRFKFTPWDGAVLNLIGSFKEVQNMFDFLEPDIILGITVTGENVTLHRCLEFRSSTNYPGFPISSFYARIAFIGVHFERSVDILFKTLSVQYSHLDEWVNISGFEIKRFLEEKRIVVNYQLPEPYTANINGHFKTSIQFSATTPGNEYAQKEVAIKQSTEIKVETSEERSFEYFSSAIYHIQNFLSLMCLEPVNVLAIQGETGANKKMIKDTPYYSPVEIFYTQIYIPKVTKLLIPEDMLFTFRHISERFEILIQNWFAKLDLLQPTYNLYFSTLYDPSILQEHRFLNLIHFLESLHRIVYGGKYLPDENYIEGIYKTLVNAIPNDTKIDLRESLESRLKYGNEFSLRKRLREIYDRHDELLNKFIENPNAFIVKVLDTRNYLVHHDKDLKERAASGVALYHLSNRLKKMVEICLLTQLSFSSEEIHTAFLRNRKYIQEVIQSSKANSS